MKEELKATFKSADTEEWFDIVFNRPIGYLWAKFFQRLGVHPNVVTVVSMIIGAGSALFFAQPSYWYGGWHGLWMNVIAILLLMWANFYDSCDGQLARMTGKKTRLGRILDGASSDVWFIPIYCAICYRLYMHHSHEFAWLGIPDTPTNALIAALVLFGIALYSGFGCHAGQCGLADYYRQIHLFIINGKQGSELDNSAQQQAIYDSTPWKGNFIWKAFLKTYVGYTRKQERQTPAFQALKQKITEKYGSIDKLPQDFRAQFRAQSLPLMKWTNILTFNTRAAALYPLALLDLPWLYFVFEIVVMGLLKRYMHHKHEAMCRKLMQQL